MNAVDEIIEAYIKEMKQKWQKLKETIIEMRDNDGARTQHEVCEFLVNYMEILEKWIPVSEWLTESNRLMPEIGIVIKIHEEQYKFIKQSMTMDAVKNYPALIYDICERIANGIPLSKELCVSSEVCEHDEQNTIAMHDFKTETE